MTASQFKRYTQQAKLEDWARKEFAKQNPNAPASKDPILDFLLQKHEDIGQLKDEKEPENKKKMAVFLKGVPGFKKGVIYFFHKNMSIGQIKAKIATVGKLGGGCTSFTDIHNHRTFVDQDMVLLENPKHWLHCHFFRTRKKKQRKPPSSSQSCYESTPPTSSSASDSPPAAPAPSDSPPTSSSASDSPPAAPAPSDSPPTSSSASDSPPAAPAPSDSPPTSSSASDEPEPSVDVFILNVPGAKTKSTLLRMRASSTIKDVQEALTSRNEYLRRQGDSDIYFVSESHMRPMLPEDRIIDSDNKKLVTLDFRVRVFAGARASSSQSSNKKDEDKDSPDEREPKRMRKDAEPAGRKRRGQRKTLTGFDIEVLRKEFDKDPNFDVQKFQKLAKDVGKPAGKVQEWWRQQTTEQNGNSSSSISIRGQSSATASASTFSQQATSITGVQQYRGKFSTRDIDRLRAEYEKCPDAGEDRLQEIANYIGCTWPTVQQWWTKQHASTQEVSLEGPPSAEEDARLEEVFGRPKDHHASMFRELAAELKRPVAWVRGWFGTRMGRENCPEIKISRRRFTDVEEQKLREKYLEYPILRMKYYIELAEELDCHPDKICHWIRNHWSSIAYQREWISRADGHKCCMGLCQRDALWMLDRFPMCSRHGRRAELAVRDQPLEDIPRLLDKMTQASRDCIMCEVPCDASHTLRFARRISSMFSRNFDLFKPFIAERKQRIVSSGLHKYVDIAVCDEHYAVYRTVAQVFYKNVIHGSGPDAVTKMPNLARRFLTRVKLAVLSQKKFGSQSVVHHDVLSALVLDLAFTLGLYRAVFRDPAYNQNFQQLTALGVSLGLPRAVIDHLHLILGDRVTIRGPMSCQGNALNTVWDYLADHLKWKAGHVDMVAFQKYLEKFLLPYLKGYSPHRAVDRETENYFDAYQRCTVEKLKERGLMDKREILLQDARIPEVRKAIDEVHRGVKAVLEKKGYNYEGIRQKAKFNPLTGAKYTEKELKNLVLDHDHLTGRVNGWIPSWLNMQVAAIGCLQTYADSEGGLEKLLTQSFNNWNQETTETAALVGDVLRWNPASWMALFRKCQPWLTDAGLVDIVEPSGGLWSRLKVPIPTEAEVVQEEMRIFGDFEVDKNKSALTILGELVHRFYQQEDLQKVTFERSEEFMNNGNCVVRCMELKEIITLIAKGEIGLPETEKLTDEEESCLLFEYCDDDDEGDVDDGEDDGSFM
ncbi:hypothetical protein VKT23_020403 [Stygiomarasmius scandens]|uniref:Homeobox domain-containing protein n=1 Tax=Marasmiellus scandens TaxID=2682957 RepID=A0ABR1IN62_9AGAR